MRSLLGVLTALILAVIAQKWLGDDNINAGMIMLAVSGGIFAWFAAGPRLWPMLPPRRSWNRLGRGAALAGALLAVIATVGGFAREAYGGWALWLWLGGVILFLAGVWWDDPSPDPEAEARASAPWHAPVMRRRSTFIVLALILVVAVFARFYALDVYPHGLQSDEANNGLDALKWLSGAGWMPYAETNEGQATLFTWLIALYIKLFGQSVTIMRMVPATAGVLTVLTFYFLAREVYDQRIALLTSALLAADRWHITFSRIVYELILAPLVLSLQVLFLIKALKTGRRRWWALAGAMLALGLNTYTAYRVVPFFMLAYFIYWLIAHRERLRQDLEGMGFFVASALIAVAPLGVYVVRHWSVFVSRMNHISVFRDVEAAGSYAPIWANLHKVLLMFHVRGDMAALNNLPGAPMLHVAVGISMALGLVWAVRWFWKELPALYLLWFGSVASLAVLSVAHEAPNARRPIALIPLIYLLVAITLTGFWRAWGQAFGEKRSRPLFALLTALVIIVMGANLNVYFRVQAVDQAVWNAFSPEESAIGEFLSQQPDDLTIYLDPQYVGHSAIRFIGGEHEIIPLNLTRDIPLRQPPAGDVLFILEPKDQQVIPLLQQLYPTGVFQPHQDRFGNTLFLSYAIPSSAFVEARGLGATYWAGTDTKQAPVRQERASTIDFDFTRPDDQPLLPPFTALYEGALLAPTFGDYRFSLTVEGGEATLYFDDQEALRAEDGVEETTVSLAAGFQSVSLRYVASEHPGLLRLAWATPDAPDALHAIPAAVFYTLPGASNGLLGYYYDNPDWSGQPILVQRDLFIAPNDAAPSPYSVRWIGKIAAPESGPYVFGVRSDDGSLVYIDEQLVVDNSGQHGAEYREGVIDLSAGWHDIEVRYSDFGGSRAMELWWRPPGGANALIPSEYLRPIQGDLSADVTLPAMPAQSAAPQSVPKAQPGPQPGPEPGATAPSQLGELGDFAIIQPPVSWTFGSCGSGEGDLSHPAGVAINEDGVVYVADVGNHRIVAIDEDGKWLGAWGKEGDAPGKFLEIFDLAITPEGDIAALDAARQVISLWSPDGEFLDEIGAGLSLYHPRGFDISDAGDLFIADTGGGRIVQADANGQLLRTFGGPDAQLGPGQPTDVAVESNGYIYVPEPAAGLFWRVQVDGDVMDAESGPKSNTVESPHAAALSDGRVFLTDPETGRVLLFDEELYPLVQFGQKGAASGQFNRTLGVDAVSGMVVVTDPDLCRVTAFGF